MMIFSSAFLILTTTCLRVLPLSSISPKSSRPARAEWLSPSLRRNTKAKDRKAKTRHVNAVRHVLLLDSQSRRLETAIRPTGWI